MLRELNPFGQPMRKLAATIFAAIIGVTSVSAQAPEPEDVIGYRQSLFKTVMWNFAPMGAMVRGVKPWDAVEFKRRSVAVAFAAVQLEEAFSSGSGTESGVVTDALSVIWADPADFKAKLRDFQRASNALRVAATLGDQDAVKRAFDDTRNACKGCHQKYRAD